MNEIYGCRIAIGFLFLFTLLTFSAVWIVLEHVCVSNVSSSRYDLAENAL